MKGNMGSFVCALPSLLLMLVMSTRTVGDITCGEAIATLLPCQNFLVGNIPSPSPSCCVGAQKVTSDATSREIRQMLCNCFKQAFVSFGVKPEIAKKLPGLCQVEVPVPVDPTVDCSKIP